MKSTDAQSPPSWRVRVGGLEGAGRAIVDQYCIALPPTMQVPDTLSMAQIIFSCELQIKKDTKSNEKDNPRIDCFLLLWLNINPS